MCMLLPSGETRNYISVQKERPRFWDRSLRLPDLLTYLKMDTYLMDINTGEHYAVYSDRIQKMSVTPKLYSAWGYRQLLQTIQTDALRFGVNSPEPSTSGVSQRVPTTSRQTQPSPVNQYTQPPASLADSPSSSMSPRHSALNSPCRCSCETNEIRYCRIMWQPQMLSSTRSLFLND